MSSTPMSRYYVSEDCMVDVSTIMAIDYTGDSARIYTTNNGTCIKVEHEIALDIQDYALAYEREGLKRWTAFDEVTTVSLSVPRYETAESE